MADKTKIEWTEASWNPIAAFTKYDLWVAPGHVDTSAFDGGTLVPANTRGWFCTKVSPGCANCYAEGINIRLGNGLPYTLPNLKHIEFRLVNLDQPLRWKRPRQIFVCSMCDIFHAAIPRDTVDLVFAVMAMAPHHIFQVLTKRAKEMRDYVWGVGIAGEVHGRSWRIREAGHALRLPIGEDVNFGLPLQNVALGVSAEDQPRLEERIHALLATPAASRFLSCEPLLGPLTVRDWITPVVGHDMETVQRVIHWVIVGGESGPRSRQCNIRWIRDLVRQCKKAGVPVFVKQLGGNLNDADLDECARTSGRSMHHRKGGDPAEWPADLRVRANPLSI